jgi:hypothetical protein
MSTHLKYDFTKNPPGNIYCASPLLPYQKLLKKIFMMHFYKPQPFIWLLAALLVFVACKKSADSGPAPVTDPLSMAAAKPGDTIVIKGQNFSTVAGNNTVKFNGVQATVVSATTTELTVVIPANGTSGAVTVTVNGVTTEVGSLVLNQPTYYCIKMDTVNNAPEQLVAINPADGKESSIAFIGDFPTYAMPDIVYLSATNEIIYFNDSATALVKINVTTKQTSTLRLPGTGNLVWCDQLVTDKSGNLYTIKHDISDKNNYLDTWVKVDAKTGGLTPVTTMKRAAVHIVTPIYLPSTNEIVGVSDFGNLFKTNLTTKDTSSIQLSNSMYEYFYGFIADKQGNLIGYKMITNPNTYQHTEQVVKINPITGVQTVIAPITGDVYLPQYTICSLSERNELAGIREDNKLYKFNLGTKTAEVITLTTQTNFQYYKMTNN